MPREFKHKLLTKPQHHLPRQARDQQFVLETSHLTTGVCVCFCSHQRAKDVASATEVVREVDQFIQEERAYSHLSSLPVGRFFSKQKVAYT
jgi:hypothetical protein